MKRSASLIISSLLLPLLCGCAGGQAADYLPLSEELDFMNSTIEWFYLFRLGYVQEGAEPNSVYLYERGYARYYTNSVSAVYRCEFWGPFHNFYWRAPYTPMYYSAYSNDAIQGDFFQYLEGRGYSRNEEREGVGDRAPGTGYDDIPTVWFCFDYPEGGLYYDVECLDIEGVYPMVNWDVGMDPEETL